MSSQCPNNAAAPLAVAAPSAVAAASAVADPDQQLISIWDSEHIMKLENNKWKCGHCNETFSHLNASKALAHVSRTPKQDIKMCTGSIPPLTLSLYRSLMKKKEEKSQKKRRLSDLSVGKVAAVQASIPYYTT